MLKRLFCNHRYDKFRNIYGDEINFMNARCEISCSKCGKTVRSNVLNIGEINQQTSDGYHTFEELYEHRMALFSVICNSYKDKSWKSKLHDDGTMYDDYFIVGVTTENGNYTYHYHMDYWDNFEVKELENAPVYDGHSPSDYDRLYSLFKGVKK